MQQHVSRSAVPVRRRAHAKPTTETKTGDELTWKLAAIMAVGYLALMGLVGLAILVLQALSTLYGAYYPPGG